MADWALITGASRGIGREAAARFRREGWSVMNVSRRPCPVQGVVNVEADLSLPGWEQKVGSALRGALGSGGGRLSLVHNAALYEHDDALSLTAEHLRRVLEVNVVVPALLNSLARSHLTEGSSILYVGSTLSEKAVKGAASYATSKHALVGLMRATCQDLVGMKVHTACICPGFTDTEMLREHIGGNQAILESVAKRTTFGRLITPEEIADVLFFCANNPVLNGVVIHAHLGQIES
jgi:NAD(P)-dependent dehydrogenase (short-subunit alcohol dehydrogenase family)